MAGFSSLGATVLSPTSGQVQSIYQGFTELGGDPSVVPWITEVRHLEAIAASDLLWVVVPDGHPGESTTMEIGYAYSLKVPIYSARTSWDEPLQHFVRVVSGPERALEQSLRRTDNPPPTLLMDPKSALDEMRKLIDQLEHLLKWDRGPMNVDESNRAAAAAIAIRRLLEAVGNLAS
jgi:nucleoside 2-deoxyribosyltransferase